MTALCSKHSDVPFTFKSRGESMNGEPLQVGGRNDACRSTGGHSGQRISALALALSVALGGIVVTALPAPVLAQTTQSQQQFSIPAGSLREALDTLASQSGITVLYSPELVAGKTTRGLSGRHLPAEALRRLLQDSGVEAQDAGDAMFTLRQAAAPKAEPQAAAPNYQIPEQLAEPEVQELERLTITGTRIRGGTTPSPVITIGAEQIQAEGFTDLGEVIRSVPQNFNGGQNPGVIGVSGSVSSQDLTGGAALNLRGLGPDASLTLLNGRRLAYDGIFQAVDISAIPVEAVERLEIVSDGASAVYGSDAVGGVANVMLVRDFDGVAVGARYGRTTDGGLGTRDLSATAGTTWAGGGLIATLKDTTTDPIYAHQRSYTDHLAKPYTIYNGWDSRNGLVSAHQSLGDLAELRLDTFRNEREATKHVTQPGAYQRYATDASVMMVSPSMEFFLARGWSLTVGGTYGRNEFVEERHLITEEASSLVSHTDIDNKSRSFEVGAEGPLFAIGGGDARLALGVGSRADDFRQLDRMSDTGFGGDERARHAYAELNLPLLSPPSEVPGIRRLEVSAAVRRENYDSFGDVTTPKFGVIYSPSVNVTLKTSWGKSFKAPTLNHRHLNKTSYLWSAAATGGSGYPADATVLMSYGGNADLRAERATTWTASLAVHPEATPGLEAELTVFSIDYTDRVVEPINYQTALSNPAYSEFVDHAPTPEQQADLLEVYTTFYNLSGASYDPTNVVAIIRGQFINAARQQINGLDLSGSYGFNLGNGRLTLRGSTSWIESTQKNSDKQPEYALAGTVFNPARVNSRVGAVWASGGFSASGFTNYTSGVTNQLATVREKTASFTTIDTTLNYEVDNGTGIFAGLALALSVQNLLNRAPPLYTPRNANFVPYDATNYSAMGRFISVSVSKRW